MYRHEDQLNEIKKVSHFQIILMQLILITICAFVIGSEQFL